MESTLSVEAFEIDLSEEPALTYNDAIPTDEVSTT